MTTTINIRRYNGALVGEESQASKLDVILRHEDVGSWALTVPNTTMAQQLIQPGAGISVHRNNQVLISGPMTKVQRTSSDSQDQYIISGLSDDCYLWDRIVQPSNPQTTDIATLIQFDAYDSISDDAETTMKYYVQNNLLDPNRLVVDTPTISIAPNFGRGLQVVGQGRYQLLGDFIKSFAVFSNNMGFGIKDFVFDVNEPVDRSNSAVFSVESGNVVSYSYTFTCPKVTHPYVGGTGDLDQRLFYVVGDDDASALWGRRIESFIDARDTSDPVLLAQRSQTAIINGASQTTVTLQPRDVPFRTFGVDYNLGDIANINGVTATIGQVELTLDSNGEIIVPTGSATSSAAAQAVLSIFDDMRTLRRQLLDLQTRV